MRQFKILGATLLFLNLLSASLAQGNPAEAQRLAGVLANQAEFPADLPCGVLSEDAVYDLLDEHFQMGVELLEIVTKMIKER